MGLAPLSQRRLRGAEIRCLSHFQSHTLPSRSIFRMEVRQGILASALSKLDSGCISTRRVNKPVALASEYRDEGEGDRSLVSPSRNRFQKACRNPLAHLHGTNHPHEIRLGLDVRPSTRRNRGVNCRSRFADEAL